MLASNIFGAPQSQGVPTPLPGESQQAYQARLRSYLLSHASAPQLPGMTVSPLGQAQSMVRTTPHSTTASQTPFATISEMNDPAAQPGESNFGYGVRRSVGGVLDSAARVFSWPARQVAGALEYAAAPAANPAAPHPAATAPAQHPAPTPAQAAPQQSQPAAQVFGGDAGNLTIVRNNNPGAIEDGPFAQSQPGYVPGGGRFARFDTLEHGQAAHVALLGTHRYAGQTLAGIISSYLGTGAENSPQARANYLSRVSASTGISPDQVVAPGQRAAVALAMQGVETGTGHGGYSQHPVTEGGLPAPFVNPFDPSYGNAALAEVNNSVAAASRPETMTTPGLPPAPEMPAPTPLPRTDFTRADAALEAMRPVEITEQDKLRTRRRGVMQGLGEALMHMPAGAGLGQVLAMAGGGALAGRGQAEQDIEQRMERFEQRMAQFHAAVYTHEEDKAQIAGHEAQAEAQQLNQYALARWQTAMQDYRTRNNISVTGDGVVTTRAGANGEQITTRVPFTAPIQAAGALQRAQILSNMGGQLNSANGQVTGAANSYIAAQAAAAYTAGHSGGDQALLGAPAFMAQQAVHYGRTLDVIGSPQELDRLHRDIAGRLNLTGLHEPGPQDSPQYAQQYRQRFEELMVEALTRMAVLDPTGQFQQRLFAAGGGGAIIDQSNRYRSRSERSSTDARGRVTTSVTTDGTDN